MAELASKRLGFYHTQLAPCIPASLLNLLTSHGSVGLSSAQPLCEDIWPRGEEQLTSYEDGRADPHTPSCDSCDQELGAYAWHTTGGGWVWGMQLRCSLLPHCMSVSTARP